MTPSANIGMRNPEQVSSGTSNTLNSISSQGMPQGNSLEEAQEPIQQNPAEQFLIEFSKAFEPVKSLLENPTYAIAQKEGDLVKRALENYMEAVITGLSVQMQQMGGESMSNSAY